MHSKHNVLTSIPNWTFSSSAPLQRFMRKQIPLATVDEVGESMKKQNKKKEARIKLTCDVRWKASSKTPTTATHSFFMMDGILFFLVEKTWMEQETKPLLFFIPPSDVINHAKTPAFMYHSATNVIYFYLATNYAFCVIVNRIRNKNKWIAKLLNAYLIN